MRIRLWLVLRKRLSDNISKSARRKRQGDMMEDDAQERMVKMSRINDTTVVSNNDIWAGDYVVDVTSYRAPEARMC